MTIPIQIEATVEVKEKVSVTWPAAVIDCP